MGGEEGREVRFSPISGPEKFEECLGLVCEYSLYTDALNIYSDRSSPEYKVRMELKCQNIH